MNGLALLRRNRGYSQEDVAKIMGKSRQTIASWETGRAKPDIDSVEKLAEIYDVPILGVIEARKENVQEGKENKNYGLSVNIIRRMLGITTKEMATRLKISVRVYRSIENGKVGIYEPERKAIGEALGIAEGVIDEMKEQIDMINKKVTGRTDMRSAEWKEK